MAILRKIKVFLSITLLMLSCKTAPTGLSSLLTVLAGATLAETAHVATDYITVLGHESGHSIAHKALAGSYGTITIIPTYEPLKPFFGYTDFGQNIPEGAQSLVTAAGPYGGLITIYATIIAAEVARSCTEGQGIKTGLINGLKRPLSIYADIVDFFAQKEFPTPSLLKTTCSLFALLKSGSMIGELLYGFSPLYPSFSDGAKICGYSLGYSMLTAHKICMALAISPAVLCSLAGLYLRYTSNNNLTPGTVD